MRKPTEYYTLLEAAKKLGVSKAAVHRAIREGRIKAKRGVFKITREFYGWKIPQSEIKKYQVDEARQEAGKKNDTRLLATLTE